MDGDEDDDGVPKRKHGTGGANKCLNGHCRCGINASGGPALSQIWRKRKEQLKLVLGGSQSDWPDELKGDKVSR